MKDQYDNMSNEKCNRCNGTGKEPYFEPKRIDRNNRVVKDGWAWACPKCHNKHYNVYANVCPSCGLDFDSQEFNEIVRNLK